MILKIISLDLNKYIPEVKLFALAAPENSLAVTVDENVATPEIVTLSKFV